MSASSAACTVCECTLFQPHAWVNDTCNDCFHTKEQHGLQPGEVTATTKTRTTLLKATPKQKAIKEEKSTPVFSPSNLRPTPKLATDEKSSSDAPPAHARLKKVRKQEAPPLLRKMSSAVLDFSKDDVKVLLTMRAKWKFKARKSVEIDLEKGDVVNVVYKGNSGWYVGTTKDGRTGRFPSNYCVVVTDESGKAASEPEEEETSSDEGEAEGDGVPDASDDEDREHAEETEEQPIEWSEEEIETLKFREYIAKELLSTEESYVQGLLLLKHGFVEPIKSATYVDGPQALALSRVFSTESALISFHTKLLSALRDRIREWNRSTSCVGDVLVQMIPFMKLYVDYVNNYPAAINFLEKLRKNKKFLALLDTCGSGDNKGLHGFGGLLVTPIQRIPRYGMLLKDLMKKTPEKHKDFPELQKATTKILEMADFINEQKRREESERRLARVNRSLRSKTEAMRQSVLFSKFDLDAFKNLKDHQYRTKVWKEPVWCFVCAKLVSDGGKFKGYECKACKIPLHAECRDKVAKKSCGQRFLKENIVQHNRVLFKEGQAKYSCVVEDVDQANASNRATPCVLFLFNDSLLAVSPSDGDLESVTSTDEPKKSSKLNVLVMAKWSSRATDRLAKIADDVEGSLQVSLIPARESGVRHVFLFSNASVCGDWRKAIQSSLEKHAAELERQGAQREHTGGPILIPSSNPQEAECGDGNENEDDDDEDDSSHSTTTSATTEAGNEEEDDDLGTGVGHQEPSVTLGDSNSAEAEDSTQGEQTHVEGEYAADEGEYFAEEGEYLDEGEGYYDEGEGYYDEGEGEGYYDEAEAEAATDDPTESSSSSAVASSSASSGRVPPPVAPRPAHTLRASSTYASSSEGSNPLSQSTPPLTRPKSEAILPRSRVGTSSTPPSQSRRVTSKSPAISSK
eukprot:CAMPEP_0174234278 /NCGR_PEP_ID=MMETSP0417-20130205/4082_1 /TAXON_ID=242541 /ORGANISM="Mayorella sp, Strain BSH-02190019" /LENGTH=912 /DNA_ID=CAMNT_0015312623 /DNA_START=245 /DNA_END=2980 /DNA_ORIENTATION=+